MSGRFKHLLEPIRDLASNWNVDIAHDLEQYLNELEVIQISLDGGNTIMNFAEAALLIQVQARGRRLESVVMCSWQGSTCVYSRKVEYLHRLVFAVLEIITDRQQKQREDAEDADDNEPEVWVPVCLWLCFHAVFRNVLLTKFNSLLSMTSERPRALRSISTRWSCIARCWPAESCTLQAENDGGHAKSNQNSMLLMLSLDVDNENPDPNKDLRFLLLVMPSLLTLLPGCQLLQSTPPAPCSSTRACRVFLVSSRILYLCFPSVDSMIDNKLERSLDVEKIRSDVSSTTNVSTEADAKEQEQEQEKAFNDPNITNIARDQEQTIEFDMNFDHEDDGEDEADGCEEGGEVGKPMYPLSLSKVEQKMYEDGKRTVRMKRS
eukprot:758402-Hanusia_phi.AAC.4